LPSLFDGISLQTQTSTYIHPSSLPFNPTLKMRFISIIVPAALSLAAGCHAWTQAPNGEWVADNNMYQIAGGE
jgi:hypothetical protein